MNKLVMLVEGEGDRDAVPQLVKRLVHEQDAFDCLFIDKLPPLTIGGIPGLAKNNFAEWRRYLQVAIRTRKGASGLLVVLDGDEHRVLGSPFCARDVARMMVEEARAVGAGRLFSLAVVFACLEFESWLIAGVESLAGRKSLDGLAGVRPGTSRFEGDVETHPRNAKGWLSGVMEAGYKPTIHQAFLTSEVDLNVIRSKNVRSFRRMESALAQLTSAFRSSTHVVTPDA